VEHSHPIPEKGGGKDYVFTIRDPRDAFISFYLLYVLDHDYHGSQEEFFHAHFKGEGWEHPVFHLGWRRYTERWIEALRRNPEFAMTRHEKVKLDPVLEVGQIAKRFGYETSTSRITEAWYEVGMKRWDPSNLPVSTHMGMVGRWRGNLDPTVECLMLTYCGDLMAFLGYQ